MRFSTLFSKATQIAPNEVKAAVTSFVFIFLLMASYMIAKPVRDSLSSEFTDPELARLWTLTFLASIVAVFIYNLFAARLTLKRLVPGVFVVFALSFILTALALKTGYDRVLLGKFFYVWISVFSLFHISVFWSFMSQLYSKGQSKRIFAFINLGASAGAILGSLAVNQYLYQFPLEVKLVVTSATLLVVIPLIRVLDQDMNPKPDAKASEFSKLNANPFSGIKEFITHKRLIGIASFIFIFVGIGTFFYLAQKEILSVYSKPEREQILSVLNIIVNVLTFLLGLFATNRIAAKFGLATALAVIPVIMAGALILFSTVPTVAVFLILETIRKSGNYAITRPSREILFTSVDQEARFKTKPFIDVAVYRGGDVFWGWFFVALGVDGIFGLDLPQKLVVGAVIALVWAALGFYLGRKHEQEEIEADAIKSNELDRVSQ
ncbi:MAG: NTP/NDP exchange transporter [Verrucomicrobiales bacterium]